MNVYGELCSERGWRGAILRSMGHHKDPLVIINVGGQALGDIMGRLDSIDAALDGISTELAQLVTQIEALQAGQVTQEEIDALVAKAGSIGSAVDAAIEPDAGEEEQPVP